MCQNLRTFTVDRNQISECDMIKHETLVNLSVVKNKIKNLDGFTNLTALVNLNLAENEINATSGIKNCNQLQVLNLSQNKITGFSTGVPSLPGLIELNLAGNPIDKLEELANLISLKNL